MPFSPVMLTALAALTQDGSAMLPEGVPPAVGGPFDLPPGAYVPFVKNQLSRMLPVHTRPGKQAVAFLRRYSTVVGKKEPDVPYARGVRKDMLVSVIGAAPMLVRSNSMPPEAELGCEGQA